MSTSFVYHVFAARTYDSLGCKYLGGAVYFHLRKKGKRQSERILPSGAHQGRVATRGDYARLGAVGRSAVVRAASQACGRSSPRRALGQPRASLVRMSRR